MKKDERIDAFLELAAKEGTTKSLMSDVVGMPDEKDKEFIRNLIQIHEKMTNGLLAYTLKQSREEFENYSKFATKGNEDAKVNQGSNMTYDFELPNSFVLLIEKYYPTMFRDRKHFAWFKKNLKGLMVRPNKKKDYRIKDYTTHVGGTRKSGTKYVD